MRREACEHINSLGLGYELDVVFNTDASTYNFEFLTSAEKLLGGSNA